MKLRRFNNALSVAVVLLGLYIVLSPFLPLISFWLRDTSPSVVAPYAGALAEDQGSDSDAPIPEDNRLVIPSIGLNEPVLESSHIGIIKDGGTWRRPNSATPLEDNNTVIVGHRFYGSNTSTFYHLDKVKVGDILAVYWEGEEIIYEVTDVAVVPPEAVEIEAPTAERQLTLYTCTPLWTASHRLVVTAKPIVETES